MKRKKKGAHLPALYDAAFSTANTAELLTATDTTFTLNVWTGGPLFAIGTRQTFALDALELDVDQANQYANSISYRDGWQFYVRGGNIEAYCATYDPIDRRCHVTITRAKPIAFPTNAETIDHLALALIREIEDHERLEWLHRHRPGVVLPQKLFRPHQPGFLSADPFADGQQVYEAHDAFMREAAK